MSDRAPSDCLLRSWMLRKRYDILTCKAIDDQPRPQGLLASQYGGGRRKTLPHGELKRSLFGAFYCEFIHELSLVYFFQNKNGGSLGSSWKLRTES